MHAYVWCTDRRCWQSIMLSLTLSYVVLTSVSKVNLDLKELLHPWFTFSGLVHCLLVQTSHLVQTRSSLTFSFTPTELSKYITRTSYFCDIAHNCN